MNGKWVALAIAAWTGAAVAEVPRPEYPRPQFVREAWVNLNGDAWTYQFDFGHTGRDKGRELNKAKGFKDKIIVPFCPESRLSGVGYTDVISAMWYHRKLPIPSAWAGKCIHLNFGGVDYESEIYIDGKSIGLHFGGGASFTVDLTPFVKPGQTHDLVVRIKDDIRGTNGSQPRGKQYEGYQSTGCHYTRTTGIWQTVWLEAIDRGGLESCRIVADFDAGAFVFTPTFLSDDAKEFSVSVKTADGKLAGSIVASAASGVAVRVPLSIKKSWSPESPHLYDVVYEVKNAAGRVIDRVTSYAGLRKITIEDGKICLNGTPRYLRFVLDQGFYPDGIWTAPTDAALKHDIELAMAAGFNGARLHQKVFEERFHYWADRLGYLTWGEIASWGAEPGNIAAARNFLSEWCEVVCRDLNHPSIIAWTPYNETWSVDDVGVEGRGIQHQRTQNDVYRLTKALDPTRPVNTASGGIHSLTDIWSIHSYSRPGALYKELAVSEGQSPTENFLQKWKDLPYSTYNGQPFLLDEFGGLAWVPPDRRHAENTWGYGKTIKTEEEFFSILRGEVEDILKIKSIAGFCYTQLTDVEQEQNGVYFYDRTPKFDVQKFRAIFILPQPSK